MADNPLRPEQAPHGKTMAKRLPPLNPLRTFEVAARSPTFTAAANELGVTQAAVSRQIGVLEGFFGVRLFERDVRAIRLTPVGRRLQRDIIPAFEILHGATEQVFGDGNKRSVRIRTYPTFATRWLIPQMAVFMAGHPSIGLQVETAVKPDEFARHETDLSILFGDGSWPGVQGHPLFRDEIEPVCNPRLVQSTPLKTVDDLRQVVLLYSKYRVRDWHDWLAGFEGQDGDAFKWQMFESSLLTCQAAIEGLGVAMGQVRLLSHDLESGALVRPFGQPLVRDLHYWIVWPTSRRLAPQARLFVDWLLARE